MPLMPIGRILSIYFKGSVGRILQKFLNAEFPGILRYLTDYAAMLVGAIVTILVQSSSVFTSTLTPLVGESRVMPSDISCHLTFHVIYLVLSSALSWHLPSYVIGHIMSSVVSW